MSQPGPCETCQRECPNGALLCEACVARGVGGPVFTETGRRIEGPRLQPLPPRTEEAREQRDALQSPPVLTDVDYPALESRAAASDPSSALFDALPRTREEQQKAIDAALAKYNFKLGKVRMRPVAMLEYELVDLRGGPSVLFHKHLADTIMESQVFEKLAGLMLIVQLVAKARMHRDQEGKTT